VRDRTAQRDRPAADTFITTIDGTVLERVHLNSALRGPPGLVNGGVCALVLEQCWARPPGAGLGLKPLSPEP